MKSIIWRSLTAVCWMMVASIGATAQYKETFDYTILSINDNNSQIMEINLDGTIKRTAPTGREPHEVVVFPRENLLFIANTTEPSISITDFRTFKTLRHLKSPYFGEAGDKTALPHGINMSHDGNTLYVTTERYAKPGVVALDWRSGTARAYIETGQRGGHLVRVHPTEERAYVMNRASSSVSVIDTRKNVLETNIPVPGGPIGFDFSPSGDLWVGTNDGAVSIIDTKSGAVRKRLTDGKGKGNGRMYVSPDGRFGIATHADGADVYDAKAEKWMMYFPVVNDQTVTGIKHAMYLAFSPTSDRIYMSVINASSLLVFETKTFKEIGRWKLPTPAYTVDIFHPDGKSRR